MPANLKIDYIEFAAVDLDAVVIFSFLGGRRFQFADPAGNELAEWSDR